MEMHIGYYVSNNRWNTFDFLSSTRHEHVILGDDKSALKEKQIFSVPFPFTSVADYEAR